MDPDPGGPKTGGSGGFGPGFGSATLVFCSFLLYRFYPQPKWQLTTLRRPNSKNTCILIEELTYQEAHARLPYGSHENSPIIWPREPESMQQYSVTLFKTKSREMTVRSQTLPYSVWGRRGKDDKNLFAPMSLVLFSWTLLEYLAGI
jgi:hypothetical protein